MNSRLPQELQTRKVVNLPDDIRSVVEELIANKFNLPEIMNGEGYGNDFLDPATIREPQNRLLITIRMASGRVLRLVQIISLDMRALRSYDYPDRHGASHPVFTEYAKRVANEIDRYSRKNGHIEGSIRDIEAEMNGYRDIITNIESLARFIYNHYREEELRYYGGI